MEINVTVCEQGGKVTFTVVEADTSAVLAVWTAQRGMLNHAEYDVWTHGGLIRGEHADTQACEERADDMAALNFDQWLSRVNRIVSHKVGVGIEDGIDWPSRQTYDGGASPQEGAYIWAEWQDYPGLTDLFEGTAGENLR